MSRRRKHVIQLAQEDVEPPGPDQAIVRALGTRGGNIVEVEFPDGRQTLCLMPAKFNKKLWVRRGGYVIVEHIHDQEGGGDPNTKVTGTIVAVLYEDHIKQLKKIEGVWPAEFAQQEAASSGRRGGGGADDMMPPSCSTSDGEGEGSHEKASQEAAGLPADLRQKCQLGPGGSGAAAAGGNGGAESDTSSDDSLPPVHVNRNRRVVYHEELPSSSSSSEDEGGDRAAS